LAEALNLSPQLFTKAELVMLEKVSDDLDEKVNKVTAIQNSRATLRQAP